MRGKIVAMGVWAVIAIGGRVWADSGPTMMGELQNARVVVLARGTGAAGLVVVEEVVKGVESRRFLAVAGVAAGERAVVLERYEERRVWGGADTEYVTAGPDIGPGVWPVEGAQVRVPNETGGWRGPATQMVALAEVRAAAEKSAPEAAGLQVKVVDGLFFPEKSAALKAKDPEEALYVQVVIGVKELRRDVGFLAGFLESQDGGVREAAQTMLRRVTGAIVAGPEGDGEAECRAAAERWRSWWSEHAAKVMWSEGAGCWVERTGSAGDARKWPAVPADEKLPDGTGAPAGLVAAIVGNDGRPDGAALEREVRAFVDGGVMRDRVIAGICGVDRVVVKAKGGGVLPRWAEELLSHSEAPWIGRGPERTEAGALDWACGMPNALFGGMGAYLPTEPRLRKDVILDRRIPAELRARMVVENAVAANVERFVAERKQVLDYVKGKHATGEEVTRAVYWEPRGGILDYALFSFGELEDETSQRRLLKWYLAEPMRFIPAIDKGVEAQHGVLIAGLLEELKGGTGATYQWAARTLTLYKVAEALPLLVGRLGDADARIREWTAFALCREPSRDAVPALMEALAKEKDDAARANELMALEQTGDMRAEGVLLAATKGATDVEDVQELCRGLARMKSEKGLGFIARVALNPPGESHREQTQWEAVEAFGYVTGAYQAYPPRRFWESNGIETKRVEEALPVIRKWVAEHEAAAAPGGK